jgi:capsid portal protein
MLQKSLSSGIPFITSHVYHLQSAFKFNNLYFMTIQHIEKLVILENSAKRQQKESPFCCLQTILFSI